MEIRRKSVSNNFIFIFIYFLYSNLDNQKVSSNSPEWFNVMPEWKIKQYKDYIAKNEDTMNVS